MLSTDVNFDVHYYWERNNSMLRVRTAHVIADDAAMNLFIRAT